MTAVRCSKSFSFLNLLPINKEILLFEALTFKKTCKKTCLELCSQVSCGRFQALMMTLYPKSSLVAAPTPLHSDFALLVNRVRTSSFLPVDDGFAP